MNSIKHENKINLCPVCASEMQQCFTAQVLGKYTAQYEVCDECGFLRAKEPFWLNEAYSRAIAAADTGLVMRNISLACKLSGILYWLLGERGKGCYLDIAGGYGMLTRLMRDFGFDFYWSDEYCENLLAYGFEYQVTRGPCVAVTAMEVLEHLTKPTEFVKEALSRSGADTLIFTTELYEGPPPYPDKWWYYAFSTGQHIGFFQRRTLECIAKRLGLHFSSANGIHIFSKKSINEKLLLIVTGRWVSRLTPWVVRRVLGTKTMLDHQLMLQKID